MLLTLLLHHHNFFSHITQIAQFGSFISLSPLVVSFHQSEKEHSHLVFFGHSWVMLTLRLSLFSFSLSELSANMIPIWTMWELEQLIQSTSKAKDELLMLTITMHLSYARKSHHSGMQQGVVHYWEQETMVASITAWGEKKWQKWRWKVNNLCLFFWQEIKVAFTSRFRGLCMCFALSLLTSTPIARTFPILEEVFQEAGLSVLKPGQDQAKQDRVKGLSPASSAWELPLPGEV